MAEPRGIYDPDPIQPVCKIGENVGVWSQGRWNYFSINYIEPLPRCEQMTFDMGAVAAGAQIASAILGNLRLDDNQLLHLRFEAIDDVEGILWEQAGQGRFYSKFIQARVDRFTGDHDPYYATTTFFVLGKDRDPWLQVNNPTQQAQAMSRFSFWGFKYLLQSLDARPEYVTLLPAEGRAG